MLPFVGALYSKAEFTTLHDLDPWLIQYAMKVKRNVYQDGDIRHDNIVGFINSSAVQNDIANVY
jgi:hypothetical protein